MREFHPNSANATLRYHDLPGKGNPLLFIHGLGCASSCDYPQVVSMPPLRGKRAVLIDLFGSGFSDKPETFGYSISDHARVISEFITESGFKKVHLFGHSMGGSIAIEIAVLCKKRIRSIILSEPNLDSGGGTFSRPIAEQSETEYVNRGHRITVESAIAQGNSIWASSLSLSFPAAIHREAVSLVKGASPSWRDQLISLQMPRTILFGERSLPEPDTTRLPELGIAVRIVRQSGHSMTWENPADLAKNINASVVSGMRQ
jgi:pimeloyl-ACP methyl ester carboxylesterase